MARPRKVTRRERGSGSVLALRPGVYKLKWSITRGGQRQQRYRTVHGSLADAKRILREITDTLTTQRVHVAPGDATIADLCETWFSETITPRIDSGLKNSIARKTAEEYAKLARLYIAPGDRLGAIKLSALRPPQIADWVAGLLKTPRSGGRNPLGPKTVTEAYHVLRKMIALAVARGMLTSNPCDAVGHDGQKIVQLPRRAEKTRGSLSLVQIAEMQSSMDREGKWFAPIIKLMLYTGLRIGEALALRWSDVSLDHGALHVRQTVTETKAGVRIKPGAKSRAGVRTVALPVPAVQMLHDLREQRPAALPEDALVFRDERVADFDWPLSPRRVSKRFSRWCERHPALRIRGRVPSAHAMRHTFVSHALMAGAAPSVLADQIGHSETEMQRQYADILLDAKRTLAAQFEARLRGKS